MAEFHISRQARNRYNFDEAIFALSGNVILANFPAARLFAQKMNHKRNLAAFPEQAVKAGQINALGLVDEILHFVISLYREQLNRELMEEALEWLCRQVGPREVDACLSEFALEFPPAALYKNKISLEDYLKGSTEGISNRAVLLEEMLMLWVTNENPATEPFRELFDDKRLSNVTAYPRVLKSLHDFFDLQPRFGPENQNLIDMLRSPAIAVPFSLPGQLEFMREHWGVLIGRYLFRLLTSLDLIKEEERQRFFGPGVTPIPLYDRSTLEHEQERFSQDREWMPRLVLIAKNAYVWLDQLSKKYSRAITQLDQIPEEELDNLASWGFTGLWLIGVWERSHASQRIKQMCGNPEAVASAYSLWEYSIAGDLGGEEAYQRLRDAAWQRGMRLASDMVPNHMGIDSPWVMEHPDWFISTENSPFPAYSFNGPDLSSDGRAGIFLEDHYYSKSDAAVVFKRIDRQNGHSRYVYHGNDGTSMPWNDTAQLNYLNPDVREAVIQTILKVADRFSIIRFDAAMTLAKRHFQRLWFPEPGAGGDIPSRAENGLPQSQFNNLMPMEFWREVVDRVAAEKPDTLLLAEAFWLMEGYFVRTLGMHRVYNSAFMNLLRNEDNAKFRQVLKNTLEFDPEILKRYVNFMNNPDERTAVDQFGKDDKYFGVCAVMATVPGLPMFGHGQVEGFTEKYGMEYRRAYWDEKPDERLVMRHQKEIFPLLRRRADFAEVGNFLLYDFYVPGGSVDENVLAFSNGWGGQRSLVVYHNRYASTSGWIRISVGSMKKGLSGERLLQQRSLGEGLKLTSSPGYFCIFRDHFNGLEYIRSSQELIDKGLYLELGAYKSHVFLDFREVQDTDLQTWDQICQALNGRGVPSVEDAAHELVLQKVLRPLKQIFNEGYFRYLLGIHQTKIEKPLPENLMDEACGKLRDTLEGVKELGFGGTDIEDVVQRLPRLLEFVLRMGKYDPGPGYTATGKGQKLAREIRKTAQPRSAGIALISWTFLCLMGEFGSPTNPENLVLSWFDEWRLDRLFLETYQSVTSSIVEAEQAVSLLRLLMAERTWFDRLSDLPAAQIMEAWLSDPEILKFLKINRYQDVLWFNKEAFEAFLKWMLVLALSTDAGYPLKGATHAIDDLLAAQLILEKMRKAEKCSGFEVEKLLDSLGGKA